MVLNGNDYQYQIVASIVLFNHSYEQVEAALMSLLSESCVDKIVLVDNGGSAWASALDNPRISYISAGKNVGFGKGHNISINRFASSCHYFLICNPDISFDSGSLAQLFKFACDGNHPFVSPRIVYDDGNFQHSCRLLPTPANLFLRRFLPKFGSLLDVDYEIQHADFESSFAVPVVSGCFMLISASLLTRIEGFDQRYFMYMEDIDLCRRALKYTDILYYSGVTIRHVFGKGSYKSSVLLTHHMRSAVSYFSKWGWFYDPQRRQYNQRCLQHIPVKNDPQKMPGSE